MVSPSHSAQDGKPSDEEAGSTEGQENPAMDDLEVSPNEIQVITEEDDKPKKSEGYVISFLLASHSVLHLYINR